MMVCGSQQYIFTEPERSSVFVGMTVHQTQNISNKATPKDSSFYLSTMKLTSVKGKGVEHHRCVTH